MAAVQDGDGAPTTLTSRSGLQKADARRARQTARHADARQVEAAYRPVRLSARLGERSSMGLDEFDAISKWVESERPIETRNGL